MRLKTHFLLAAIVPVLLCLPAPACSHDDGAKSGAEVDWSAFTSIAPPGEQALNISDVERETGLPLALPSYLPEGMSNSLTVSSAEYDIGDEKRVEVSVMLFERRGEGPRIKIDETLHKPGILKRGYPPSSQIAKMGETDVACWVEVAQHSGLPTPPPPQPTEDPERHMIFKCGWATDELFVDVRFVWGSREPVPGEIAPERREEAMKVIASMIEDPYIP